MKTVMRRPNQLLLAALVLGCGAAPGEPGDGAPENVTQVQTPEVEAEAARAVDEASPADDALAEPSSSPPAVDAPAPAAARAPCSAPPGVSASPRSVAALVELINSLPRPTSLPCLLETLERPLEVYLTRSELSLQPADGVRNPRTFIVKDKLVLSVVPGGEHSALLEIGYMSAPGRSQKGEIAFPITEDVTPAAVLERISFGHVSICGGCHGAETRPDDSFFTEGSFESAIAVPLPFYEVEIESLREEARLCDPSREASRCDMLSALFDRGEVIRTALWPR